MDISIVKELVSIMESSTLTSMEVELSGQRVKLGREVKYVQNVPVAASEQVQPQNIQEAQVNIKVNEQKQGPETLIEEKQPVKASGALKELKAPMVGIFRSLESVGKGQSVVSGTKLKKGETACLIEAMKLLIEIEMEEDGEIVERLVEDGEMVEYGQALFLYK